MRTVVPSLSLLVLASCSSTTGGADAGATSSSTSSLATLTSSSSARSGETTSARVGSSSSSTSTSTSTSASTGSGPRDGGAPEDAGVDAGPGVNLDGGTTLVVMQPVSGTPIPTTVPLQGPGVVLMGGGTDVDAAFVWIHDTLAGSPTAKLGNLVVLRADDSTDNAYTPYIYALAPFQSVMTLYLGGSSVNETPATPTDLEIAAYYVSRSDAVFFAGGDQADYVSWNGSPLMLAVRALYERGGVVGGTSAGCSIQGPYVFDAVAADADDFFSVETSDAVKNPFERPISFTRNMLQFPALAGVLTDPHFVTRDRFGRLAAFVARQYADGVAGSGVLGVGIDESNALLVDKTGHATLVQETVGGTEADAGTGAYVFQPSGAATTCERGKPLLYSDVKVTRLTNPATDSFDFAAGCGTGVTFQVTVDGTHPSSPYSPSPYTIAGTSTSCP